MSETLLIPTPGEPEQARQPTVYFIDDSATMREVIKIAFRRENINVITCGDARSAIAQFEQTRPDVVITDVIMPDQDGFSVCSEIKAHPNYSNIPVVLMSGVVNKTVADKAVSVRADELIRKPFQPQELIHRVKSLLRPKGAESFESEKSALPSLNLNQLFAPAPVAPRVVPPPVATRPPAGQSAWPRALAEAFASPVSNAAPGNGPQAASHFVPASSASQPTTNARPAGSSADLQKLRAEITWLDSLVKKLQAELQNERQYNQSLENQIRALTHGE
jgi:CheY-like chemotaxis protein